MTKKVNYVFDDELYHHGIKGQRWGDRRFQNEDGSWTPEGRERYGKGDGERVKIQKAKATYETQKYKANLKSKAQKEKDKRAAAEERNRIKEQAKTNKLIKKEQAKLDQQGAKKFSKTKNMSDEDLAKAIDRLKLQSEYNKQYALAKNPDGALAKADRFFEGPTGKAVTQVAVAVLPSVATTLVKSMAEKDKRDSEIEKNLAEAEKNRALARSSDATAASTRQKSINDTKESDLKRRIDESKQRADLWETKNRVDRENKEAALKNQISWGSHAQEVRQKEIQFNNSSNIQKISDDRRKKAYNTIVKDYKNQNITSKEYLDRLKKYGFL